MKAKTKAWAIKRRNKISAKDIFEDKDVVLDKGEVLVRVEIKEI